MRKKAAAQRGLDHVLIKIKIKKGAIQRLHKYLDQIRARMSESEESLIYEGCRFECFFVFKNELFVFKSVQNFEVSKVIQKTGSLEIYTLVKEMAQNCFESREEMHSILTIEPTHKRSISNDLKYALKEASELHCGKPNLNTTIAVRPKGTRLRKRKKFGRSA